MRGELGDKARINHIIEAILEIETYIRGVSFEQFTDNSMMRFACIKQVEIIGEASIHLSEVLKNKFSNVEWTQIKGMRNVFVHEYFGIDDTILWEIVKFDLPELKVVMLEIVKII